MPHAAVLSGSVSSILNLKYAVDPEDNVDGESYVNVTPSLNATPSARVDHVEPFVE